MLAREARLRRAAGGQLYFHQLQESARELLERGDYLQDVDEEDFFETKGEAIADIFQRLDRGICVRCDKRIFNECRTVPKVEIEAEESTEEEDTDTALQTDGGEN
jgi:SulP family sulfate permease